MKDPFKIPNPRSFPNEMQKRKIIEQNEICAMCTTKINLKNSQGDHIIPISRGGNTHYWNLQMLCIPCHKKKTKKDGIVHQFGNRKPKPKDDFSDLLGI